MKKIWSILKNWYEKQREEQEREITNFEERLGDLLEFLFIKQRATKEEIKKKLKMNEKLFESLKDFLIKRSYIIQISQNTKKYFEINNPSGIDYLLDYKKIEQERKTKFWVKLATIVLALSAILTLFLTLYPSVLPQESYICPPTIYKTEDYSAIVNVPISNLKGTAYYTHLELFGENINKTSKNKYIVIHEEKPYTFTPKIKIINPELNEANFYFRIKYRFMNLIENSGDTKTCYYEKDEYGNFKRKDL